MKEVVKISKEEIKDYLPHREPFLFVDEIEEAIPGEKAVGVKTFSEEESFFEGHFPNNPILPGVLIIETAAQVSAFILLTVEKFRNSFGVLASVEEFKFLRKVLPNEKIKVVSNLINMKLGLAKSKIEVFVNDNLVAKGIIAIKILG